MRPQDVRSARLDGSSSLVMGNALGSSLFSPHDKNKENNFLFICNEPENSLYFDPSHSYSVSYGIRGVKNPDTRQLCVCEEGARRVSSVLIDKGVVPAGNSLLFLQSRRPDACTFEGMEKSFKKQANNVGEDGIFVFIFSGHGSQGRRALLPLDYESDRTCVTAAVLNRWLREGECKAKCILFVINCCYAGEIAEATVREADNLASASRLHVMAACSANEVATTLSSLGCATYCYLLWHAIQRARFPLGQFPVKTIHEACKKLTVALTSLLISSSQQERGESVPETMHPLLTHSRLHHVVMELAGEGEEQTDAEMNHFAQINEMYDRSKPDILLAERSIAWIESTQPALTVLKEGLIDLDSHALTTILLSMLYSVAHLQMITDRSTALSANLFLTAYRYVAAHITTIFRDVEFDIRLAAKGLEWYINTLLKNGYEGTELVKEFNELYQLMSNYVPQGAKRKSLFFNTILKK